jgi:hypothetical protein
MCYRGRYIKKKREMQKKLEEERRNGKWKIVG